MRKFTVAVLLPPPAGCRAFTDDSDSSLQSA